MTITRSAPSSIAARAASCPTAPAPQTATTPPGRTPPRSAPIQPVAAASEANSARSSLTPSGMVNAPTSAYGTRMYCAWLPAKPPIACEYPKTPPGAWPHSASVIAGLVFPLSQDEYSSFSQYQHRPHATNEDTTTRSPTLCLPTSGPTSTISPRNSCPSTSPARMNGMYPPIRCRSEPQVVLRSNGSGSRLGGACSAGEVCTATTGHAGGFAARGRAGHRPYARAEMARPATTPPAVAAPTNAALVIQFIVSPSASPPSYLPTP